MQSPSMDCTGTQPKRAEILEATLMLIRFLNDESGATAIEYALIAAGVGLAVSAAATQLNTDLGEYFKAIGTKLDGTQPK